MHCLSTRNSVRRYRLASILILLKWLFVAVSFPLFCYALLLSKWDLGYLAIYLMLAGIVVSIGHWLIGDHARCPLCFVSPFSHRQHAKSRKALHFLGSYRIFVATSVIFKGSFHCPYCGENTAVKLRQPRSK